MRSRSQALGLLGLACIFVAACGDGGGNDNHSPGPTATPTSPSAGPTATAPPCPTRLTYIVNGPNADLDAGWSGIYADQRDPLGGSLSLALDCPGEFLGGCGSCAISGPMTSTTSIDNRRCVNASNVECTSDADCPGSTCAFFFGTSIPVSSGGFPVCFINRVAGPVTGTLSPELGAGTSNLPIVASIYSGIAVDMPCPVCTGATLGSTGTCVGGDRNGMSCTVHGTTTDLGNVSFDCPAAAAANIANLDVPFDLTTGTRELPPTATCTGSGGTCWCAGQQAPNGCDDGVCTVDADGEGACAGGPADLVCTSERFRSCTTNVDCPSAGDSCQAQTRECLGATDAGGSPTAPIGRTGTPSQTMPTLVSAFCLGATSSPAINTAAGFPGPGTLRLPTVICISEHCPTTPPTAP
ncbi:MAG: hypothetical protein HY271_19540 [Deltaproteobacteria bacterium]|nr:hypothetical protein [Deltaproteobacteria bacterium]